VRIDIATEAVGETNITIKFSVIDTGIGITESGKERLFKAFSQVDASTARTYGGTGLGLAISMKLVQLMGGEIGVDSEVGKGSTFWFKLPFECDDPRIHQCLRSERNGGICEHQCQNVDGRFCTAFVNKEIVCSTKGRSVLVVDDNQVQRDALCIQLQNWGMECTLCDSAEDALCLTEVHRTRKQPFDLFVIDSTLTDGDGIELARKLHEREKDKRGDKNANIILLHSLSEDIDHDLLDAMQAETIGKPVFASALFNAVMNHIFDTEDQPERSGIFGIDSLNSKVKIREKTTAVQQSGTPERLKSHLAGQLHILVCEDNRVNQIVAKNLLAEAGFTCDIANNGREGCRAVQNEKYDIVLMDCQMPEMDGFEATDLIRPGEREHGTSRLPIIALTANAVKEDIDRCFEAGMDAYCSKPINPAMVIHLIEEWYEKMHTGR
jgi:CheY-like chemotaxis protein